jgi:mRNA interferase MazF
VICEPHDVVVVPFPFADRAGEKRRPALVLSTSRLNRAGHTVMAMITTRGHKPWPGDHPIGDLQTAGLPRPCMVRLKLFTIDNRLIIRRIGHLAEADISGVASSLSDHLA